ncbi:hypothetical protein Pcinc_022740 [Petrolisthes cinctipes]|uniref:Protein kinase domain-containing protein n=1 Tax=Petrolisthes cinctipes TaxID=88211 RepID=A0AAE1FH57_PETCI|nr:hypothetical protein Pcinc_022740 [Petrolisthes cinctipes]
MTSARGRGSGRLAAGSRQCTGPQSPLITHQHLKVENLLISELGHIKWCDFGSAMRKTYKVDQGWNTHQHGMLEDEVTALINPMSCIL